MAKLVINYEMKVEVIHLDLSDNGFDNQNITKDTIKEKIKEIRRNLKKSDDLVTDLELSSIEEPFEDKRLNSLKTYYEDKRLYRLSGPLNISVSSEAKNKRKNTQKQIKVFLNRVCGNERLANTWFRLIDNKPNILKFLSPSDEPVPRLQVKKLKAFGLGTLIDLTTYVEHYSSHSGTKVTTDQNKHELNVAKDDMEADFQFDKKQLLLYFRLKNSKYSGKHNTNIRYRFDVEFKAITSALVSLDNDVMKIFLTLSHPPILFKVAFDDMTEMEKLREYQEREARRRYRKRKFKVFKTVERDIGVHTYDIKSSEEWIRENEFYGCIPEVIGKSTVLLIEIPCIRDDSKERRNDITDPFRLLFLMKRFSKIPIHFGFTKVVKSPNQKIIDTEIDKTLTQLRSEFRQRPQTKVLDKTPVNSFAVEYSLSSVFSFNFKISDELAIKNQFNDFMAAVVKFSSVDPNATEESLFQMRELVDRNAIFSSLKAFNHIFNDFYERNKKLSKEKVDIKSFNTEIEYIRRCILTPTRVIMLEAQPTLKSRFIVESESDFTIRLSIREDDLNNLQFSIRNMNPKEMEFLHKIIKNPLKKGILIGNRLFEFLGSSTSQLRDTGMVLYAKDGMGRTADSIRESIGDMSAIKRNVSKYVARIGLAFSQVMTHIDIPKDMTRVDKDIQTIPSADSDKIYTFSDGIGRVSEDVLKMVYEKLEIESIHKPCAMQIRYGGCKGMLVLDPTLKGKVKIVFRESMRKYKSDNELLGIIKFSKPRPLYLNRPLITILEQLDYKNTEEKKDPKLPNVFNKLLMDNLKDLANAMRCECHASELLQTHCSSSMGIPYQKLFDSGISFLTEPLFRQMIDSVVAHRIKELKTKARIKVPMSVGRTVFGVLDETGTLEYGQVFVQLSEVDDNSRPLDAFILKGEIMVTKFPCLHPGDVRKLEAVDVKGLHHIRDCIVFPQKGPRPHPDEMAGSDLDGDEYAVIWPKRDANEDEDNAFNLIFEPQNEKPMDFPTPEPKYLPHDARVEDILDFYCDYIVGNTVGLLANSHLANADREEKGIFSEICMSLAEKYAIALDFAKTGIIERMDWRERPKMYPDFMEKFAQKRSYLSRNILGQLYRHCDRFGSGVQTNKKLEVLVEPNSQMKVEGYERFIEWAKVHYNKYKSKIDYLLNQFGVDSEALLLSGAFSKTSKYMSGRSETNDIHELLENIVNKLFVEFKRDFENDSEKFDDSRLERCQRASAWYMMPFLEDDQQKGGTPHFGFSWIITDHLCQLIGTKGSKETHVCQQSTIDLLDSYFHDHYLYREPNTDEYRDESDKRQRIMEERWKTAFTILKAWLERQDHLFFKRRIGRRIVSSTDAVMSDMDRKMTRKMMQTRVDLLSSAREPYFPLKTAGQVVMDFIRESLNEWLNIDSLDQNNRVVDTPMVKFGYSALTTLNNFFKTRDIRNIICIEGNTFKAIMAPITDDTFYIPLPTLPIKRFKSEEPEDERSEKWRQTIIKYVEHMVQHPEVFCEQLKRMSGAIDIVLMPYPVPKRRLEHYYLMTVTGTDWAIRAIKCFVCHPSFFNVVANSDQQFKKRNLFVRGAKKDFLVPNSNEVSV